MNRLLAAGLLTFAAWGCSGKAVPEQPAPRYNAVAALDADSRVLHLAGGAAATGLLNDAWLFDLWTREWVRVPDGGMSGRSAAAARAGGRIWVSGGTLVDDSETDRLLAWPPVTGAISPVDAGSTRPSSRREHSLTRLDTGRAVLVGGMTDDAGSDSLSGEVWGLGTEAEAWTALPTTGGPEGVARHAAALDEDDALMWIHGGVDTDGQSTDSLWQLDTTTWTWTAHTPAGPAPRTDHLAAVWDHRLIVWGGHPTDDDLWEYDPADGTWLSVPAEGPGPRDAFAWDVSGDGRWVVVVGGDPGEPGGGDYVHDVWILDLASLTWERVAGYDGGPA